MYLIPYTYCNSAIFLDFFNKFAILHTCSFTKYTLYIIHYLYRVYYITGQGCTADIERPDENLTCGIAISNLSKKYEGMEMLALNSLSVDLYENQVHISNVSGAIYIVHVIHDTDYHV